ncbi:F-box domain containing protein, partial [Tanacetum coccineum]
GHRRSSSIDFISQMPDDILVMILCLLPMKDAMATGSLSTRWSAIGLMDVCVFRICFDLDESNFQNIDSWLRFALDKKVEKLYLNLINCNHWERNPATSSEFPLPSLDGKMIYLADWPLSNMVVEMQSLKEVSLLSVNITEPNLLGLLKSSPSLERLYLYDSRMFTYINVGGRDINLKHFKLVDYFEIESMTLYDFDLISLTYIGLEIELILTDVPMVKELDIGLVSVGLENNVFGQISSCASSLQTLSLNLESPVEILNVYSIPKLPNLKLLRLTGPFLGECKRDESLLEFTSIAKAYPRLETLVIALLWFSPVLMRIKVKHAAPHRHEHLNLFKIDNAVALRKIIIDPVCAASRGNFILWDFFKEGAFVDLELAVYVIDNAVALRKIVIDPVCAASRGNLTAEDFLKREQAAQCSAERQLRPILPRGVELVIL